jgi:hypothetical protein
MTNLRPKTHEAKEIFESGIRRISAKNKRQFEQQRAGDVTGIELLFILYRPRITFPPFITNFTR